MKRLLPLLALTVLAAVAGLAVAAGHFRWFSRRASGPAAAETPASGASQTSRVLAAPDFSTVVARVEGAVVSIRAATRGSTDRPSGHVRYPGDPGDESAAAREESGSGFIIDPAGEILTNQHVIRGADRITVTLSDSRIFRATVIGVDAAMDVALLQIDAQDPLPVVQLGKSEDVRVGEWVCAIGSPIGYANSVTVGVVSSVDRKVGQWSIDGTIQTDAAMSLGSSGSPLFNAAGEVIAITSAISSQSSNIGFAIPIGSVAAVLPQLREWGQVSRGYISAALTSVTPELKSALHLVPARGALVEDVAPERSAAHAGLQTYDVVTAIDGVAVTSDADLVHAASAKRAGTTVHLDVWRDGSSVSIPVVLEERPVLGAGATGAASHPAAPSQGPLGLTVRDLDTALQKTLPAGMTGVRVADVDAAGPARLAHVRVGQVIVELNRQVVANESAFTSAVKSLRSGDVAAVLVYDPTLHEYAILSILLDQHS